MIGLDPLTTRADRAHPILARLVGPLGFAIRAGDGAVLRKAMDADSG